MFKKENNEFTEKPKWRHPEAPDADDLNKIWDELKEIRISFDEDCPSDWREWEKEEGLEGLVSDLTDKNVLISTAPFIRECMNYIPGAYRSEVLTTFISGVRHGYALAEKRKK